ncbi:Hypothetical protein SMAX5B_018653 [Scophthalmus maximus]|uniref:Uncharacterized protein n=1 Tax=Scophthalmus maximus TaxID=52904 RepID=A0A2U9CBD3_SCOMX|nr:Hypothetical protein SMAX5B_018653 [Scophthalmus maximus]
MPAWRSSGKLHLLRLSSGSRGVQLEVQEVLLKENFLEPRREWCGPLALQPCQESCDFSPERTKGASGEPPHDVEQRELMLTVAEDVRGKEQKFLRVLIKPIDGVAGVMTSSEKERASSPVIKQYSAANVGS